MTWFKLIITIRSTAPSHRRLRMRYCYLAAIGRFMFAMLYFPGDLVAKIQTADSGLRLSTSRIHVPCVTLWQNCRFVWTQFFANQARLVCINMPAVKSSFKYIDVFTWGKSGRLALRQLYRFTHLRDRFPISIFFKRRGEHTKFPLWLHRWRVLCSPGIRNSLCRFKHCLRGEKNNAL